MSAWWRRRTLKLRLTLWYAAVTAVVVSVFAAATYEIVEHRLAAELDRQLRIDFDVVEAQLDMDPDSRIRWLVRGAHGDEGFARLAAWFEVWSEERLLLFRHWPVPDAEIRSPLPAPAESSLCFQTVDLEPGLHVRLMQRPARVGDRGVVVRLFRDETEMRRTLREIIEVFFVTAPLAVLLASLGGYFVARRSLRPIGAMAEQAKKITSESLAARLPVANPHDEVGQFARVFNDTLQRLENSFAELKRFTADASHELRTPLTALRAVGEVALREADHPAISSMLEEAQRLEELIESLLTLARMESGKIVFTWERIRVTDLVTEVREGLSILAADKKQVLEVSGDPALVTRADRLLLRQAITNVLHNAVRYAPAGSCIRIAVTRSGDEVSIAVADEGPGIAPQHHQKIFERFYRVDRARSRSEGGHGLGLAIAKWSVEQHGGRIDVESAVGHGSTFRLRFPA